MSSEVNIVSGVAALFLGVQEYFGLFDDGTAVVFGYRERAKQINQGSGGANRVIFLPGDPSGAGGKLAPTPRDVGRRQLDDTSDPPVHVADIRPIASWERQFTVSIWAVDKAAQRDELAQASAAETLFERLVRAVEQFTGAGGPNVAWGSVTWTVAKENTFGTELLVGLALAHPLMDGPEEVGFPGFEIQRVGT